MATAPFYANDPDQATLRLSFHSMRICVFDSSSTAVNDSMIGNAPSTVWIISFEVKFQSARRDTAITNSYRNPYNFRHFSYRGCAPSNGGRLTQPSGKDVPQ